MIKMITISLLSNQNLYRCNTNICTGVTPKSHQYSQWVYNIKINIPNGYINIPISIPNGYKIYQSLYPMGISIYPSKYPMGI